MWSEIQSRDKISISFGLPLFLASILIDIQEVNLNLYDRKFAPSQ
jgi:hypothetical protein